MGQYRTLGWLALIGVLALALFAVHTGAIAAAMAPGEYNWTTVHTVEPNGTYGASVDVRVSDTFDKRYLGLSNTTSLGEDEGMLFVHPNEGSHSYVMRDMDFPLDIIFVDANGTVTTIHHAPVPPNGTTTLESYTGTGKYVLEVDRGWSNETGLDVGDHVCIPNSVQAR